MDIEDTLGVSHIIISELFRNGCTEENTYPFLIKLLESIEKGEITTKHQWTARITALKKIHHISPGVIQLNYVYRASIALGKISRNPIFEDMALSSGVRSHSGVIVATVLTSPYPNGQSFSCEFDCYYCPNEPGQPRSYLKDEPAVSRANQNKFDACDQIWNRLSTLFLTGHPIDKLEILVLGGTWSSYPLEYREEFCRDLYYASNTFFVSKNKRRPRLSLEDEININQTAQVRVIGLTLETRPDQIGPEELLRFRRYGCTRVQIGVQHIDDRILKKINRRCYTKDTINAIRNLKDCGFKVDIHLMPDLPGATPEIDRDMFYRVLREEEFQADQWKIYPCETTPFSEIEKWFKAGKYQHYSDEELLELIIDVKSHVHPWIRLNRVIRDIPNQYILDGNSQTNLRQVILDEMKKRGIKCRCIRCREVKKIPKAIDLMSQAKLVIRNYPASNGQEYFISYESPTEEEYLYGFCRLRLSPKAGYADDVPTFKVLKDTALIRELHVYGKVNCVNSTATVGESQHHGFGKLLMEKAEEIAKDNDYSRIAVISGIGARAYYQKLGYHLEETYMVKNFQPTNLWDIFTSFFQK